MSHEIYWNGSIKPSVHKKHCRFISIGQSFSLQIVDVATLQSNSPISPSLSKGRMAVAVDVTFCVYVYVMCSHRL